MTDFYDVIVVGLGAMGSATTYHLAKRGVRVLGLDMFEPGHPWGSSHGFHRMIRKSAVYDDGYVPLGARSFELWDTLAQESNQTLLTITGEVTLISPGSNPRLEASVEKMQQRGLWEVLTESGLSDLYPGFRLSEGMQAHYEADAGFLWSEQGILAHLEVAKQFGACLQTSTEVLSWSADSQGVRVSTKDGDYRAEKLILTTGAYVPDLLGDLALPIKIVRSVNGYFEPSRPDYWRVENGAPDFLLYVPEGSFYGMPAIDDIGLKIGRSGSEETTARTIRRSIEPDEIQVFRTALDKYMPGAAGRELRHATCMDAYTVDDDFIIDGHPEYERVIFGCGFSGRGFKYAPVIGEILADLTTSGETGHEIAFFSSSRFGEE